MKDKFNSYLTGSAFARFITAALLIIATGRLPYGYYQFIRIVTILTALYALYISFSVNKKMNFWIWIFGLIIILFNPIFPFALERSGWFYADLITALIFIVSIFFIREKTDNE
jgi:hypothetical protein